MKKQEKIEHGLNRLFSSPRSSPQNNDVSTGAANDPVAASKQEQSLNVPKMIPVPPAATLPLQIPDLSEEEFLAMEAAMQQHSVTSTPQPEPQIVSAAVTEPVKAAQLTSTNNDEKKEEKPVVPIIRQPDEKEKVISAESEYTDEQIVVFTLAKQVYGVNIAIVEGIIKMQSVTIVPGAPSYIEGVTNLRGNVVPVINLHQRLELGKYESSPDSRIIVVNMNGITAGMIVDAVNAVQRIEGSQIAPPAKIINPLNADYIRGIAKLEERFIVLLELNKIFLSRTTSGKNAI